MAYILRNSLIGYPPLNDTTTGVPYTSTAGVASLVPPIPLGTIVHAFDPLLGEGEFIYLKGVVGTVEGDLVIWDENNQTTRAVSASRGPVAVAMAANVASQFGWYQITGQAKTNVLAAFAADALVYLTATAGSVDDAVVASQKIDGARSQSAIGTPSAGTAYLELNRPAANGNG